LGFQAQGQNKWDKKPVAVLGCTPYNLGAFGAVHHLRQVLVYLNMYSLQQPEFYLANAAEKFNNKGELTDEETRKIIRGVWATFVDWIKKLQ
jgi:chromate reductase